MKVSVVVPLYNKQHVVDRTLDSICAQTFTDFEVLVVDDGSTDGSADRARACNDARVRVICQPNAGPGAARNAGARLAKGEYLAFLDADDEWDPCYLADALALFEAAGPEVPMVVMGYSVYPEGRSAEPLMRRRGLRDGLYQVTPNSDLRLLLAHLVSITSGNSVIRHSVFAELGGFYDRDRTLFGEDAYLYLRYMFRYPLVLSLRSRTWFHSEDSDLSRNIREARPVEPFLKEPEELRSECPPALRPLLERVLSARAFKTACMLGYFGHWREASELVRRFWQPGCWRLPYFWPSLYMSTPAGPATARLWQLLGPTPQDPTA